MVSGDGQTGDAGTTQAPRDAIGTRREAEHRSDLANHLRTSLVHFFLSVREMHPSFIQQDFTLCLCSSICNLLYMLRIYTRDSLHLSINWSHELTVRGGLFAENGAPILRKKICLVWVVAKVASNGSKIVWYAVGFVPLASFFTHWWWFGMLVSWDSKPPALTTSYLHSIWWILVGLLPIAILLGWDLWCSDPKGEKCNCQTV